MTLKIQPTYQVRQQGKKEMNITSIAHLVHISGRFCDKLRSPNDIYAIIAGCIWLRFLTTLIIIKNFIITGHIKVSTL